MLEKYYFKNSGEAITAKAKQRFKRFCSLKWLSWFWDNVKRGSPVWGCSEKQKNPKKVKFFIIDKTGFGSSCAWICVKDTGNIRI